MIEFERSRSPGCRSQRRIRLRSKGKTWDIIPGTERPDGFARISVKFGRFEHADMWVYVPDIGRTDQVKLWEPTAASRITSPAKTTTQESEV